MTYYKPLWVYKKKMQAKENGIQQLTYFLELFYNFSFQLCQLSIIYLLFFRLPKGIAFL